MAFAVVHSQDSHAKTPNYAKNGKNNMKEFIALHNRTVSCDEIQTVIALAKEQNNTEVIYRLSKILNDHPDSNRFNINIINYPQETDNQAGLAGTRHSGDYREALDECGRLKKGWHFVDGKVVKATPKAQSTPKAPKATTISRNTQKNNNANKKYKFIVFIGGFDRIAGIYSYQDIAVNGFYYEKTFDNGIRLYKTIRTFAKSEETKTLIEEQYTEGKDFVYLKFDGKNKEEYYSMLESHSSPSAPSSATSSTPTKNYTAETFAKDLDFNTLKRSYSWISFDPDARAERDIKQWGEIFYSLYNSLSEEAKKQGVLEAYNTAFDNGYTALLKLEKEIIATRNKTFSTGITGGAGITEKQVSTNEKRMRLQAEKSELWNQKYDKLHKILEKIAKNKPADLYEEGDVIKSTDNNAMTKLQQKLKMLQDRKTMLKNGVVAAKEYRKNKDLSVFKKYNIDKETTDTIVKHIDNGGSPTEKGMYNWFTMPYLNRDIKEVEKRIAILEKNQSQGEKETLIEGGKIVYNGEAQRLQIFFDGIPSKEVREALKSHAFKWAPTAKAWQRTLTENAKYAVNQYLIKTGILKLRTALSAPHQEDEIAFLSAAGIDYFPEAPDDETQGLGKPVPTADIYKMVTDKIIGMLKSASPTDYHRAWKDDVFFIPINYASKKPYRGINRLLLQERIGFAGAFRNPYFLTFKQIKKHKGTLKKGAKGYEVIYYSIRYVVPADKNSGRKAYSSTNAQKVLDFLHKYKLSEDIVGRIPMIRYYNVYNGADIENIDFKLDELQIGRAVPDSASENRAAQLIVENYPNPPAIKHEGNQAYYNPTSDYIKLPKQEQFDTVNDYYRTLFHELTHSTGHDKRLDRGIHLMLEKEDYAKEELVAEFGAVFLSAWAGIMWYNNKNHAAYLKGWNSAIKEAQNDNKFLMRAASLAQQATDYILALDKDGNPAFLKKLQGKKAPKKAPKTPTDKSAPSDSSSNKNLFLEEYRQLKAKYPEHLIIFSMEDQQNYTMYGKDAVIAADILNLQLLKGKGNNEFSNSVGFKYNYLREYLEKLVKAGYKVAVRGNDLDKPQSSPKKNKTTKPSNPTKTPIAPTDPMSNELLYFNSVPQRQLVTRIKAKSMKLDFEDEYYNNLADKDGYFKPDFQNKSNLKIITDNCDNFVGTINTYDYPIISVPKPKTTGIMSLKKIVSTDNMRPVMKGVYIDKNHYIATDAHKLVFIPRPKNDEYRTGTIFDINFKCKKLGGCKTEEALIDGHFPIEIINKMKSEENSYISPPLNIENVISHLYCGEKAINIFTTYEKYKVITLYFEKERKTNYINIKHLLDTLEVLRSNGAKTFTLGFLNLEGKRQINIDTDNKLKAIIMPNYYQVNESPTSENCIMIAPINLILYKQFRPKKGLSVPTDGTLFGTLPTFKTRKEAKKYFKSWAAENLTGKKVYHKELDKYVVFSSRGIDHVLSSNISFNKMKLILQAEEMLKNSHLIAFEEDYKKRENIKGVYRMRSNAILEGEDIKVILTLREGENGVIYYDHKIEEIKESTTPPRKSLANPFCGDSAPTNTPAKTVPNSTLSVPEVFVEHSSTPSESPAPSITPRNNSIANKMATLQNRTFETFIIAEPQMQAFLGDVERKNTGSTAITITGGAGSGKTRFAFQFINALAQNYKVGHASLEEQPDSKLYFDKVQQYLDQTAQANVEAPEIENMQDLQALIERNDVIVIDSFTKIREWDRNFLLDRDLRKKYNGKLFLIIFQQTVAGNMRGGTTSEFDGDIILYTQVFPNYRENYIYPSKNRYNSTPSEQLRYSVYHQQLLPSESIPPDSSPVTSNTYEVIY